MEGVIGDGTVFLPFDKDDVFNRLQGKGFEKYGNEIMYNGRTGEMIGAEIFLGPTFYLRLKHMVADKVHARGKGPKVLLTHQPTSGRSKQGGLRIGEMERDVVLAHGMSQFAKEAMMEKGDKYTWAVCKHCGTLAKYAPKRDIYECNSCKSSELNVIETPYSFKLLMQELEAMGVQMRLSDIDIPEQLDADDLETAIENMIFEPEEENQITDTIHGYGTQPKEEAEDEADEDEEEAEAEEDEEEEEAEEAEELKIESDSIEERLEECTDLLDHEKSRHGGTVEAMRRKIGFEEEDCEELKGQLEDLESKMEGGESETKIIEILPSRAGALQEPIDGGDNDYDFFAAP
jgi:hypothetical protein